MGVAERLVLSEQHRMPSHLSKCNMRSYDDKQLAQSLFPGE